MAVAQAGRLLEKSASLDMTVDLANQFNEFILNISIGPPQTDRMESAAETISDFLARSYGIERERVFMQGSYPNGTAVEPVEGGEYDVDLVAVCVDAGVSADRALDDLERKFRSDGRFRTRIVRKKPCVRLEYAPDDVGKFHVDVVPARPGEVVSRPLEVPRRNEGWHLSAPKEYTAWCTQQGDAYARTVKMMKRWRSHQQSVRAAIKSIVLQVLVAQFMPAYTVDDALRFATTVERMTAAMAGRTSAPPVINPVLPTENLAARWTDASFGNFVRELHEAHEWSRIAQGSDDPVEAADAWREIFGDDFPAVDAKDLGISFGDSSHEQTFASRGWRLGLNPAYKITISATQQRGKRGQNRQPYQSDGPPVFAGHWLRFTAKTRAPFRAEIWWQVTNTGDHARSARALRGQFLKAQTARHTVSNDPAEHWESTAYTGVHRVRALLVRQDTVVAVSEYIDVKIYSKNWRARRSL